MANSHLSSIGIPLDTLNVERCSDPLHATPDNQLATIPAAALYCLTRNVVALPSWRALRLQGSQGAKLVGVS